MQKWEHVMVRTGPGNTKQTQKQQVVYANEQEQPPNVSLFQYISQLGDEGWELIIYSEVFVPTIGTLQKFFFKRPKP